MIDNIIKLRRECLCRLPPMPDHFGFFGGQWTFDLYYKTVNNRWLKK